MTCELFNNLHTLLSAGAIGKGLAFQLTIENEQPNILNLAFQNYTRFATFNILNKHCC